MQKLIECNQQTGPRLKNKNKIKHPKTRLWFILFCTVVPVVQWLLFYVYANFSAFGMAFTGQNGGFSLENFTRFFNEFSKPTSTIREAFRNTFITFGVLLVSFPFKVMVSYFIYKKIPFARFYRVAFFLPAIIFSVAWNLAFTTLIGVDGPIAKFVGDMLGLDYVPELLADSRFANWVVILSLMWTSFPGDLIIWGGTFARIPDDVLDAAKIDGVSWFKEFTKIIVPMVWPTVGLQMTLLVCGIFSANGSVFLLTKGQFGTMTISAWMYMELLNASGTSYTSNVYNYMSAVGLILTVVSVVLAVFVRRFASKQFEEVEY